MTSEEFKKFIAAKHGKSENRTNDVTKAILNYLNGNGYVVWRCNTVGIFDIKILAAKLRSMPSLSVANVLQAAKDSFRKSHDRKGTPDILGYHRETGRFIGVEVKTGKDNMSIFQIAFQQEVEKTGAVYIVAGSVDDVDSYLNNSEKYPI